MTPKRRILWVVSSDVEVVKHLSEEMMLLDSDNVFSHGACNGYCGNNVRACVGAAMLY